MNRNGLSERNRARIQSGNTLDLIMYDLISIQSLTLSLSQTRFGGTVPGGITADTFGTVPTISDPFRSAVLVRAHRHNPNSIGSQPVCVVR